MQAESEFEVFKTKQTYCHGEFITITLNSTIGQYNYKPRNPKPNKTYKSSGVYFVKKLYLSNSMMSRLRDNCIKIAYNKISKILRIYDVVADNEPNAVKICFHKSNPRTGVLGFTKIAGEFKIQDIGRFEAFWNDADKYWDIQLPASEFHILSSRKEAACYCKVCEKTIKNWEKKYPIVDSYGTYRKCVLDRIVKASVSSVEKNKSA